MALIKCPDCGKEVSSEASACPNCGYPISKYVESEAKKAALAAEEAEKAKKAEAEKAAKEAKIAEKANAKANKKPVSKKAKIIVSIIFAVTIIALALVYIFLFKQPYDALRPIYDDTKAAYNSAVLDFNMAIDAFTAENQRLDDKISELNSIINNGEIPLDDGIKQDAIACVSDAKTKIQDIPELSIGLNTPHDNSYNKFSYYQMKDEVDSLNSDISTITADLAKITVPDYSNVIKGLDASKVNLENSYKQYKQVTNPTEKFVIERLTGIPGITLIEAATEENDPNGKLHKDGGYTSAIYFIYDAVTDSYTISQGSSPIARGTDGGGQIEVYATPESADTRNTYLASFDGSILDTGSHTVIGTALVRTSCKLTATQQSELEEAIINSLIELR